METIEAERELPPMIRQLLSRDPAIAEIWNRQKPHIQEKRDASPRHEPMAIRRALISVYDKVGLVPFAGALAARGIALVSTGGSARTSRRISSSAVSWR